MEWIFFGLLILFCLPLSLSSFIPRIKIPVKEGTAVLVYKTAEDYVWICEYKKNDQICVALVSCYKKHKIGDEIEIKEKSQIVISVFQEL